MELVALQVSLPFLWRFSHFPTSLLFQAEDGMDVQKEAMRLTPPCTPGLLY